MLLTSLYDQTVDDPEYKGYFAKTCGINSKGLFCASQEIEPHIENKFIVMSNFSNHGLIGKFYKEAVGAGADRFITAYDHIMENMNSFSVDKGFELLEKVSLREKDCSTQCSMIFQPQTNT